MGNTAKKPRRSSLLNGQETLEYDAQFARCHSIDEPETELTEVGSEVDVVSQTVTQRSDVVSGYLDRLRPDKRVDPIHQWKRCWCILTVTDFRVYRNQSDTSPFIFYPIRSEWTLYCSDEFAAKQHTFQVTFHDKKAELFSASDAHDLATWVDQFRHIISMNSSIDSTNNPSPQTGSSSNCSVPTGSDCNLSPHTPGLTTMRPPSPKSPLIKITRATLDEQDDILLESGDNNNNRVLDFSFHNSPNTDATGSHVTSDQDTDRLLSRESSTDDDSGDSRYGTARTNVSFSLYPKQISIEDEEDEIASSTKHSVSTTNSSSSSVTMTREQILNELMNINQELMKHTTLNVKRKANLSKFKMYSSSSDLLQHGSSLSPIERPRTPRMGVQRTQSCNKRPMAAVSTSHIASSPTSTNEETLWEITKLQQKKCSTQLKIGALEKQLTFLQTKNMKSKPRFTLRGDKDKKNPKKRQVKQEAQDKQRISNITKQLDALALTLEVTKQELEAKQDMSLTTQSPGTCLPAHNVSSQSISPLTRRSTKNSTATRRSESLNSSTNSSNDQERQTLSRKASSKTSKFFEGRSSSFVTRLTRKMNQLVEPVSLKRGRSTVRSRQTRSSSMVIIPTPMSPTLSTDEHPHLRNHHMTPWLHEDAMTASTNDLLGSGGLSKHLKNVPQYRSWDVLSCDSGFATQTRTDEVSTTRTVVTKTDEGATRQADANDLSTIKETMAQIDDLEDFFNSRLAGLNIADEML